jgi:hypothetical protein
LQAPAAASYKRFNRAVAAAETLWRGFGDATMRLVIAEDLTRLLQHRFVAQASESEAFSITRVLLIFHRFALRSVTAQAKNPRVSAVVLESLMRNDLPLAYHDALCEAVAIDFPFVRADYPHVTAVAKQLLTKASSEDTPFDLRAKICVALLQSGPRLERQSCIQSVELALALSRQADVPTSELRLLAEGLSLVMRDLRLPGSMRGPVARRIQSLKLATNSV